MYFVYDVHFRFSMEPRQNLIHNKHTRFEVLPAEFEKCGSGVVELREVEPVGGEVVIIDLSK